MRSIMRLRICWSVTTGTRTSSMRRQLYRHFHRQSRAFNPRPLATKARYTRSTTRTEGRHSWPSDTTRKPCTISALRSGSTTSNRNTSPIEVTAWWCSTKSMMPWPSSRKPYLWNPMTESIILIVGWSMRGWWTLTTPFKTLLRELST